MTDFIIKKLKYDLSSNAGLTLVGQFLKRTESNKRVDHAFPLAGKGIINGDISKSHLGLLVQGKNDFDAIEALEAMSSLPTPWTLARLLRAPPCANAWTPTSVTGAPAQRQV